MLDRASGAPLVVFRPARACGAPKSRGVQGYDRHNHHAGAYAITDPRLGASGVIPAGAVVIMDGIIRETGPFDAIVPKYPGADILVTASAQPTRHLPAWPPIILTRHRPLFEQVQLHLAANGLRIARGTIPKRGFSAFSKVALICRPAIRDTNAEGHLYRLI